MFVRLYRDSFDTPWGFRLQGGKDLNQTLVVQRVFSNSPAEGELQRGDIILSINGRDAGSFTHKQAQDAIKFSGGQIELNIQRPAPGSVHIQPLTPSSPTKAPSNLFIRRASDTTQSKMPAPPIAGHKPRKVTMNKFGGGTTSFGQSFKPKQSSTTWQPVSGPSAGMMNRVQDSLDSALSPTSPPQGYYQQPQQYRPPPQQQYQQQQYQPPPQQYQPPPQQYQPPPQQYQPPPQQYQPPPQQYQPPQQQSYQPTYQSIGDLQPDYVRAEDPVPEEDYEYTSVTDRKKQFGSVKSQPPQIKRGKKKFVPPVAEGYQSFGTDYSKPRQHEPEQPRFQPRPHPVPPPVNRAPSPVDMMDGPKPWTGTLRSESTGTLKPWEVEDQEYIMPSQLEAMKEQRQSRHPTRQQRQPPAVSPKPKGKSQQIKVAVAPANQAPPARQISVRSVSNEPNEDGSKAVHLQYNSPMGLYSKDNIDQSYQAQIHGDQEETSSTVSKQQQQQPGDRDWNQSYVYKMVKEETKRETQTYPGQSPVTTQTYSSRTYQSGQPTQEDAYGISDF